VESNRVPSTPEASLANFQTLETGTVAKVAPSLPGSVQVEDSYSRRNLFTNSRLTGEGLPRKRAQCQQPSSYLPPLEASLSRARWVLKGLSGGRHNTWSQLEKLGSYTRGLFRLHRYSYLGVTYSITTNLLTSCRVSLSTRADSPYNIRPIGGGNGAIQAHLAFCPAKEA
jgi:hypothetical protein